MDAPVPDQDRQELEEAQSALLDSLRQNALMRALATAANRATSFTEVLLHARSLLLLHDDWHHAWAYLPHPDGSLRAIDGGDAASHSAPDLAEQEQSLARRALADRTAAWADDGSLAAFLVTSGEQVLAVLTIASDPPIVRREMVEAMVDDAAVQLARVAEREQNQRELADARDQAMAASRQKSEFLATMSHEIRTPLNGIIGLNDLLLRTSLTPDQLRLATGLGVASHALLGVINDVLDFSKIESGHLELERVPFDPASVLDDVGRLLATASRESGIELVTTCSPDLPRRLLGDPTRLSQILTNLASNALKFTESGDVVVSLVLGSAPSGTTRTSTDVVWVQAQVSDTGVGISSEQVQRLFEPFTQADASTTRRYGGTGLGLSIARELAAALGGELGHAANPGGGSIFSFSVPFAPEPVDRDADEHDDHAASVLTGRHLVVIEPNRHARDSLEQRLARWGVRATGLARLDEAPDVLSDAVDVDGIILTLGSPGAEHVDLAGLTLLRAAWSDSTASRPVVGLMPHDGIDHAPALAAGAACVLAKPLTNDQLRVALVEHVAEVAAPSAERRAGRLTPTGAQHRVLVVEDNPINQLVATGILESLGYDVDLADDGAAGLRSMRTQTYDLVLMDVQMPVLDGYDTTRALRAAGSRVPVVAMTAAAIEGERERCLAAGMDDFLTKPVNVAALADVLERWLRATPRETSPTTEAPVAEPGPAHQQQEPEVAGAAPERVSLAALELIVEIDTERLDVLRDLDPNNTIYIDRALGNFAVNSVDALDDLRTQLAAGDRDAVKTIAHKLAGSALNLGVVRAGETARAVELGVEADLDDLDELVEQLHHTLVRARTLLAAYQASYS